MTPILDCGFSMSSGAPDFTAIKTRQQATWSSGDYAVVGTTLQIVGEELAEAMDLRPGWKVLDIAAGNGNATLAAARRWCQVTSTDYVEALLMRGRRRAEADGLAVEFRHADAEALPFADASFDAVISTFGAMFAPDQSRVAAEMLRVTRPGGRIGLANWTPDGFIGQMFRLIGSFLPPPAGVKSPALWGTPEWIARAFGAQGTKTAAEPRYFRFRYRSPEHFLDVFRAYYGPTVKAFEALDEAGGKKLAQAILELIARLNTSGDETMLVAGEYLEVVVTRR